MLVFDDEYNTNTMMKEDGATTLDAEFSQYPYSEDEWLDDGEIVLVFNVLNFVWTNVFELDVFNVTG